MREIFVWAHRGASGYVPENTLEAFAKAVEMGADGVELDVQLSKDGELVVIHDETLDRVSDAHGYVKDYTLEQLKELNVSLGMPDYEGITRIPTLREVFELLKPSGLVINVEMKNSFLPYEGMEEKVLELIREMELTEQVWISSFNHQSVKKVKELCPEINCGFLFGDIMIEPEVYGVQYGVEALHPSIIHYGMDHDYIKKAHEAGLKVHIWTVNDEALLGELAEAEADALITNYPDLARNAIWEKELELERKAESRLLLEMEDGFLQKMKEEVEPFLNDSRREEMVEGYQGKKLHCCFYDVVKPKATVFIVHGFSEFEEKYHEMIYHLMKRGYSVCIPELRGHGRSDRLVEDLQKVHVNDFGEYIRDLRIITRTYIDPLEGKKILFGHSMGGAIATLYAEKFRRTFDKIVLSSPMIQPRTGNVPKSAVKLIADTNELLHRGGEYLPGQTGFSGEMNLEHSSCSSEGRYLYSFEKRCEDPEYQTHGATYGWVKASLKATKMLRRNVERIEKPVLLMYAGQDSLVDPEYTEEFGERLADVKCLFFENSKHEVFNSDLENRKRFYDNYFSFMEEM